MKKPEKLKKGDKVAIVCPASCVDENLDMAKGVLEGWGLNVIMGQTVCSNFNQFSGNDSLRAEDLQTFMDDPSIKAIFAARGGYGTVRIIDILNFEKFSSKPKWIIGFSDITVLHSHIHALYEVQTIHGQMPKSFYESSEKGLTTLHQALFGEKVNIDYNRESKYNRDGTAKGILAGGNLSLLHCLIGTASDIDYNGKVLFIEDVGEKLYNLDRMMWTMKRAGKLENLAGLLVGGFTSLKDSKPPFGMTYEDIIYEKVEEYGYPVAFRFPAGHISDNRALIFGAEVNLTVKSNKVKLEYNI